MQAETRQKYKDTHTSTERESIEVIVQPLPTDAVYGIFVNSIKIPTVALTVTVYLNDQYKVGVLVTCVSI